MLADRAARVRFLFHCWLLLVAAAALCDEAAAQGAACGKLDPGQVDPLPDAGVRSSTVNSVTLDWQRPDDDYDTKYYYIVSCPSCPTKQANTTDETYTFSDLTAASEYSFTIQAGCWNCRLSTPFYLSGKTTLTSMTGPVHISDITETSFRAHWAASPDAGVRYEINGALTVQSTSYVFSSQESGARVEVVVRPVKTGFDKGVRIFGTAFTKLFAIDVNSSNVTASETAISASWHPSITADVFYQLTCIRIGSADVTNVTSSSPSAICSSLLSGESYNLSLAVKKEGGFDDAVKQLPNQLTIPVLISDPASFTAAAAAVPLNDSLAAEAVLRLNWTSSSAQGADLLKFQVRSSATADLLKEAPFDPLQLLLSLSEEELFSLKLTVTVAAVANKSGLRQESPEISIADGLQMPPNRPLMSLTADKRSINVSLTASSRSELLKATAQTDNETFVPAASCHPDPGSGSCTVTLQSLKPYANYSVAAVAELSSLPSLPQRSVVRTLEDAPTQPMSVKLNESSLRLLCEWQTPSEVNGIIRNYTAKWGSLNFTDSSVELPGGVETLTADNSSLELPGPPQPGHAYFCRVSACTGGGCSLGSDRADVQLADGEAAAVAELKPRAVPGKAVNLSWKPLSPLDGQGVVFEYALRLDGPGGCAAALRLNCSDCGRNRQKLQSDEARQRLDNLTRNCAAPVSVQAFSFYDTELVLEVSVSSGSDSSNSLQPWTEYSASLWPVNLAGPGGVQSVSFRSPETPSEAVRSLRATNSESEVLVEFQEPELANGLLQVFAVQLLTSDSVCSQIVVLNSISTPGCHPTVECSTTEILKKLTDSCNSASVAAAPIVNMRNRALSNSKNLTVRMQHLQPGTKYSVLVTPISQTLAGASAESNFITPGGGITLIIVLAVGVSVLVAMAIVAALLGLVWYRRRNSRPSRKESTSMEQMPAGTATREPFAQNTPGNTSEHDDAPPTPPPSPTSVPAGAFAAYAKSMLSDTACLSDQQYVTLKKRAVALTSGLSSEDGLVGNNREKNRYINILPFDWNRVRLSGENDYINASFVSESDAADRWPFIACQGPRPATVSDHWRMIWEQMVPVAVMLTACVEKGKTKCEQYWPDREGESLTLDWGLRVTLISAENYGPYIVRKLRLTTNSASDDDDRDDAGSDGNRLASMDTELLQYIEWEDHAVPNLDSLVEFLSLVHSVQRSGDGGGPIVVHCSAGVGRTGTFIALDMVARRLQQDSTEASGLISVFETVLQLRRCRVDMVQTKHQYAFIYRFLLNFVQKKQRISFVSDDADAARARDPVYATASAAGQTNKAFQ